MRSTFGGPPAAGEHRFELGDKPLGGDPTLDQMKQRPSGVFVDHRGDLDRLAVDRGVELEIDRATPPSGRPPRPAESTTPRHVCADYARAPAAILRARADALGASIPTFADPSASSRS
jgi:hypothetical protein